ncbi:MAG TPA: hypothetical protein PKE66_08775 [Pyrinomonadaceae bacterium]|nr:hypothetical protein [Pyrinomonadaceae bacterium]
MQAVGELGTALQVFLAASPFILILPDLLPPGSASEAVETLAEKLAVMAGEKVVANVTNSASLPDFADAVRAVNAIALGRMHQLAQIHSLRHAQGITEGQLWKSLREIYDPNGELQKGGGWDWNPFW